MLFQNRQENDPLLLHCNYQLAYFRIKIPLGLDIRAPFLETPDNIPSPKTILCAQYSPIVIQFLLILKAKF